MKKVALLSAFVLVFAHPLSAQLTPGPAAHDSRWPVLADINGDGLADVIDDATVQINAGGTLLPQTPLGVSGRVLDALDVNGDGVADLLTTYDPALFDRPAGPYVLWINNGHGVFTGLPAPAGNFKDAKGALALPPLIADFDGDGKDDLIAWVPVPGWVNGLVMYTTYTLTFLRSRGDGTFEQTDTHDVNKGEIVATTMRQHAAVGDLNRDGHPDVVFRERDGLVIFFGRGNGKFAPPFYHYLPYTYGEGDGLRVADIDGDGIPDLAWASTWGKVVVMFGDGHGGFHRLATAQSGSGFPGGGWSSVSQTMEVLHYTSSKRYDIVVGTFPGLIEVLTYSDGALREATTLKLLDPYPPASPQSPPGYRNVNVFTGKLRPNAPVDLYAFEGWGIQAKPAQIVYVDHSPATEANPPRRRPTSGPIRSKDSTTTESFTLHVISTGSCPREETWTLKRQGLFAIGTSDQGYEIAAFLPDDSEIDFGTLSHQQPFVVGQAWRPDLTFYGGQIEWYGCRAAAVIYPK